MDKRAESQFPIDDTMATRWSPMSFQDKAVPTQDLGTVLAAARWAPSSYNEQPWAFIIGHRGHDDGAWSALRDCLVPGNRGWAERAPVLILSVAKSGFERNGKPNRHAFHDVGLASMSLVLQAEKLGLATHMMAGFGADQAREAFAIPESHEPVAVMALGYAASADELPEGLRERENAPRSRKELASFVFGGAWNEPSSILQSD